jgi:hypothetical protein
MKLYNVVRNLRPLDRVKPLDFTRVIPAGLMFYCGIAKGGKEFYVADRLERIGVMTFTPYRESREWLTKWPILRAKVRHMAAPMRVREKRLYPLFGGKVIMGFASPPDWLNILDTPHLLDVIRNNGEPVRFRPGEVERLRDSLAEEQGKAVTGKVHKVGGRYRATRDGPLGSIAGRLDAIEKSGVAVLTIDSGLRIRIDCEALEVA